MGSPPQRVTIATVARQLGVHPSTVSRALRETNDGITNPRAARIREVALELGYQPNPWARSLRTQRSGLIGLVVPRLTDGVLARMFEAAEDRARAIGNHAVTSSTRDIDGEELRLVRALRELRVDGFVLATSTLRDPVLDELDQQGVPFVLLNRRSGDYPVVRGDDELGGYLATRHLLSKGHTRIGYIGGPAGVSTSEDRRRGYERALGEAGIQVDASVTAGSSFSAEGGARAASNLLTSTHPPTAIFAVNDAVAIGAMAVARDLGLTIPRDLAVVGYNDTDLAGLLPVPLSSISVPIDEMGRRAVELLLDRIAGKSVASLVMTPRLTARASSAAPRTR
jgi:LacI family transcriptional regulator